MATLGKNIFVFWNDGGTQHLVAGTRANEITSHADKLEIASATQQEWQEFIAGRKSWSFTVSFLLLNESQMQDLIKVGNIFQIQIKGATAGVLLEGSAMLSDEKHSMADGTLANGTFSFTGTGALTIPVSQ